MHDAHPITLRRFVRQWVWTCAAFCCVLPARAQNAHLKDGEQRTVTGVLRLDFRGWRSAFLIETEKSYLIDFDPQERKPEWVREVELNFEGDTLKSHVGERIIATGKMQVEGVSPYYWNGAMLMANTVRFADGSVLHSRNSDGKRAQVPPGINLYLFTATMIPRHYEVPHSAVALPGGHPLPHADGVSCSLNGGADVLNCLCSDGFIPVRAGVVRQPHAAPLWRLLPKASLIFSNEAQFGIDENARRPLTYQLVCQRKGSPL